MDPYENVSQARWHERLDAYQTEIVAIEAILLGHPRISEGRRDKLEFRFSDLKNRVVPKHIQKQPLQ